MKNKKIIGVLTTSALLLPMALSAISNSNNETLEKQTDYKGFEVIASEDAKNIDFYKEIFYNSKTDDNFIENSVINISKDKVINIGVGKVYDEEYLKAINKSVEYFNSLFEIVNPKIVCEISNNNSLKNEINVVQINNKDENEFALMKANGTDFSYVDFLKNNINVKRTTLPDEILIFNENLKDYKNNEFALSLCFTHEMLHSLYRLTDLISGERVDGVNCGIDNKVSTIMDYDCLSYYFLKNEAEKKLGLKEEDFGLTSADLQTFATCFGLNEKEAIKNGYESYEDYKIWVKTNLKDMAINNLDTFNDDIYNIN